MIAVFGHENMRQQTGAGGTSGNRPIRGGRLNNAVAGHTSEFRANMADDPETGGDVLQDLSDILAKFLQGAATIRAGTFCWTMLNGVPWQMLGQRFTFGLGFGWNRYFRHRFVLAGEVFVWPGLFIARQFGAPAFEFFQREFKLGDCFAHLFGTTTELHATELGNDELEVFDFGLLRTNQRLEHGGVVG